ncbi:hypothetical protein OUHCRE10_06380 [Enterobacter hormaechei subsp. xiangfangensis]|jgi:hypothetical protein|nr:hypothetical protein SL264_18270 [Enterobacter cloacae]BCZ62046.1 hypothetical protein SL269_18300 [Klebsiella aerogenes]
MYIYQNQRGSRMTGTKNEHIPLAKRKDMGLKHSYRGVNPERNGVSSPPGFG